MRLVPHPANFAPIMAIGLFAGTYMDKRYAFWVPIITLVISDFVIGLYNPYVMFSVYASFAVAVLIGQWLKKRKSFSNIAAGTLAGSLLFFFTTNFAVWAFGTLYPKTLEGLVASYIAAIPFFRNSLMGDVTYVALFFGAYEGVRYIIKNKIFIKGAIKWPM